MSGVELKPCPFCGGNKHMALQPNCTKTGDYNPGDNAQPVVRCLTCYAEAMGSPWDYTKVSAIAAWNRRTPDPAQIRADALREAIWAAFIAGVSQGSDEATAYEWGTTPQQSRQQAFDDFMADWNEDSAYLRSLLDAPLSPTAVDNSAAPDAGMKGQKP